MHICTHAYLIHIHTHTQTFGQFVSYEFIDTATYPQSFLEYASTPKYAQNPEWSLIVNIQKHSQFAIPLDSKPFTSHPASSHTKMITEKSYNE